MTNPYRALCANLTAALNDWQCETGDDRYEGLLDRARALLAEPDGPAVPDGREPASVALQPSDAELDELAWTWYSKTGSTWYQIEAFRAYARAALARWGRPAAAPAPEPGEVAAALKVIDKMQQEWVLLGNDEDGTASPSLSMPISLRRFTVLRDAISRAATLLQQQAAPVPEPGEVAELVEWLRANALTVQKASGNPANGAKQRMNRAATLLQQQAAPAPVPVPVSERLPGPEDCDAERRCWLGGHQMGNGTPTWLLGYPAWAERFPDVHRFWLPANALPLPAPEATND